MTKLHTMDRVGTWRYHAGTFTWTAVKGRDMRDGIMLLTDTRDNPVHVMTFTDSDYEARMRAMHKHVCEKWPTRKAPLDMLRLEMLHDIRCGFIYAREGTLVTVNLINGKPTQLRATRAEARQLIKDLKPPLSART